MRAAWINNLAGSYGTIGNAAIWNQVHGYALDLLSIDGRQAAPGDIDAIHSHGIQAGVHFAASWYPGLTVTDIAREMDSRLTLLQVRTKQCHVLFDYEDHSNTGFLAWLSEWRALRPTRATGWTLEPHQRGWWTGALVRAIIADLHLRVFAQTFSGDMGRWAQDAVYNDIHAALPAECCGLVYDGALGYLAGMDGYYFTLERLP